MTEKGQNELSISKAEKKEIEKRIAIGALIVHEAIRQEGEEELDRHPFALMWSGLAAGLSMGFSFLATALIASHLPTDALWPRLLSSFGYSVGFIVVILGRQQLFTENTLPPCCSPHRPTQDTRLGGSLWGIGWRPT